MSATIRDVAQQAGVGLGTVSRVLNNSPLVSSATRQRVLDVIADLCYAPSQIARNLSLGKTLAVAVVAPFFTRPSVVERLRGIEASLSGSPYDLIVFNVENPERREACLRNVPRPDRVDGALLISLPPHPAEVAAIKTSGVPVVLVDAHAPGLSSTAVDDHAGGLIATEHLIQLGHRRIAYISDPLESPFNFTSSTDRFRGYQRGLELAGIPFLPLYHRSGKHGRFEARRLARELLALPEAPTAIFAASDTQALGVLEAAQDASLRVPDDLSIVGFDDIDMAEYLGLTTVRQNLFESGARGVELLLELLGGAPSDPVYEQIQPELVVRRTTGSPLH